MTNDQKNKKELVSPDDSTAELEVLTSQHLRDGNETLESDTDTCSLRSDIHAEGQSIATLKADLRSRSDTIDRLRYDLEQLRSRWMGLAAEVQARDQATRNLHAEIAELKRQIDNKDALISERDDALIALSSERDQQLAEICGLREDSDSLVAQIESLRRSAAEASKVDELPAAADSEQRIRELEREILNLRDALRKDNQADDYRRLAKQAGQLASYESRLRELRDRHARLETYSDELRRRARHFETRTADTERECQSLQHSLSGANARISDLEGELAVATTAEERLQAKIADAERQHAEEIRIIRFELGEAQQTVSQQETLNEQLASELLENASRRARLETRLNEVEESNLARVEALERDNASLRRELAEASDKLSTKDDAVNCLLAELARKTQQLESIEQIEEVIQDIDDRMSQSLQIRHSPERERMTRVLIGSVEGQELRFPLFKDRLTIGRTAQNDIQLNAAYISRRHAVIVTDGDRTRVIDWGSKNGIYVNAKKVAEQFLRHGDILAIGTAKFRYEERSKREA